MNPFWTSVAIDVLLFVYVIDCMFLGLVIMMQRSKQEGLGAAFGGGMTESLWGAQTSQVLVKATVWAAIIFFVLSIVLARLNTNRTRQAGEISPVQQQLSMPVKSAVVPTATPLVPSTNTAIPAAPTSTSLPTSMSAPATPAPAPSPTPTAPAKPAVSPTP